MGHKVLIKVQAPDKLHETTTLFIL